jgi:hypothetical protein
MTTDKSEEGNVEEEIRFVRSTAIVRVVGTAVANLRSGFALAKNVNRDLRRVHPGG